jgi:hypothetical protein
MPYICYEPHDFRPESRSLIRTACEIVREYAAQGFSLTVRQLYYQFVARDMFPATWADPTTGSVNNERSYKRLGNLINDGRMAGLIDWSAIEDRTRNLEVLSAWQDPQAIVRACAEQFRMDRWARQPVYVECWIEKDALKGVLTNVCEDLRVPYFSCRGYTSASEMRSAAQRFREKLQNDKRVLILHLGDHDPSGLDMTRDIADRLETFGRGQWQAESSDESDDDGAMWCDTSGLEVRRIALTWDQIRQYNPPPNPTKVTDPRAAAYNDRFSGESWELDALSPQVIEQLIRDNVTPEIDAELWEEDAAQEQADRATLGGIADHWTAVRSLVNRRTRR